MNKEKLDGLGIIYRENTGRGLDAMRIWAADKPDLTEDIWKLPKDCPLWNMGLSMAQAGAILAAIHWERDTGKTAQP
jgi:hypothetical protein